MLFVGLVMLIELGRGGAEFYRYSLMQKLREGPADNLVTQIAASDDLYAGALVVRQLVFVVATIIYLMWIYRAYKNLSELRVVGLNHSPAWAVGMYFVPILNLFRGFTVMQEIWKGSDPQRIGDDRQWTHARGSGLAWLWWLLYLAANVVNSLGANTMNMAQGTGSVQTFMTGEVMNLVSVCLFVVSGIALIFILRGVTDRQEQRFAALTERAP